jgi:hypothetical protein
MFDPEERISSNFRDLITPHISRSSVRKSEFDTEHDTGDLRLTLMLHAFVC